MRTKEAIQKDLIMYDENINLCKKRVIELQKELEELNKPKRFKSEVGEMYYCVIDGFITKISWNDDKWDIFRRKARNFFKTKEEAEEELERILFVNEVRDFIEEENDDFDLKYYLDKDTFDKLCLKFNKEKLDRFFTYDRFN